MMNMNAGSGKLARVSCQCEGESRSGSTRRAFRRRGFTLIELLVVITIVLIVSAVALPTVLPALSHRQVSEGARILQAALVGARDAAIRDNAPSGIRLLPDPAFPIQYTTINGSAQIDPTLPLVYNRIIPVSPAPDYSTGVVGIFNSPWAYTTIPNLPSNAASVLVLEQMTGALSEPTSWFWNIRVGERVQINNSGPWYTVVGPMETGPLAGNSELFVNASSAASYPTRVYPGTSTTPPTSVTLSGDFLYLVNGHDDDGDGYIDNGWDGVTTNFENERWLVSYASASTLFGYTPQAYTIERRPAPTVNAREVPLPSNVVIDATTWGYPFPTTASPNVSPSQERSRLPVNIYSGYVEFLVYPTGAVVPTTIYSSPSSFGMSQSFYHFWLAERSDVYAPSLNSYATTTTPLVPYLPLPPLPAAVDPQNIVPTLFGGSVIKGEYRLVTLFTRTGQVSTNAEVPFDYPSNISGGSYSTSVPFLQAQQGVSGGY